MRLRMVVPVSGSITVTLILVTVAVAAVTLRGRQELTVEKPTENVRAAPDGEKIGTLLRGASVERLGQDGKWVQFRLEGWIWGPSLEGFKEEVDDEVTEASPVGHAQKEVDKRAPRPALREREQLQRIKKMFDDEFGVFYGVSHNKIRSQLIIRFRAADLMESEALEQRQMQIQVAVLSILEGELNFDSIRVESNRVDGSGKVGVVIAVTDLEHVRTFGSEGDLEGWRQYTKFSEDGGKTWIER